MSLESKRVMVGTTVAVFALLLVLGIVFVRASIEAGEERLWLAICLFTVPAIFAVLLGWSVSMLSWPVRLSIGVLGLVVAAVLLVQAVSLADKVYESPAKFRPFLTAILKAESAYLAVFPAEDERRSRHMEKARLWQAVQRSSSA